MANFCPNCGKKLIVADAKFCPNCGYALQTRTVPREKSAREEEELRTDIAELGKKFEETVEKILQAKGYETERRVRLQGKSGGQYEIDVIAKKSGKRIAIECKNYSQPVGIEPLSYFATKLQELEFRNGIFASHSGFTDGAAVFAQNRNIETWTKDEIMEKFYAISIGRAESRKGQSLTLEYALPLNVDFVHATQIDLQNKDKLKVSNAELIYHPYFAIEYSFNAHVKDPTKKLHKFEDRDTLYVDALDGSVLNPIPTKGLGMLTKALKIVASESARTENERSKKLLLELSGNNPSRKYSLSIKDDYEVNKLKPVITPSEAVQSCIDFIIEKNTKEITYYPKTEDESFFRSSKSMTYVPKRRDIRVRRKDIVVVPRWSVDFDSIERSYKKEIFACSGEILEDTLSYCPKHFKIGAVKIVSKKTVAVCEVCGQSLCEDHVKRCPTCHKWLCEEHGIVCSVCKNLFCEEHINLICPICNSYICDSCVATCPICNLQYGRDHAVTCDQCGTIVCSNCVTTTGFIRKTRTCKKCSD